MPITTEDKLAIYELINFHGHIMDGGEWNRLSEIFTEDVVYDVEAFGGGKLAGIDAIRDAGLALGTANPLGHHVTNVVIADARPGEADVISKGLAVKSDGSVGSVTYEDMVRFNDRSWKIAIRKVIPRRTPLRP